jgi:subtilase family serine protease
MNPQRINRILPGRPRRAPSPHRRRYRRRWPVAAALAACLAAGFSAAVAGGTAASAATPLNCAPPGVKSAPCYSPQAYQTAYGVAPLLGQGIDGRGETVVMPEAASSPPSLDIRQDLAAFDGTFGLPPTDLRIVNTIAGSATPYLANDEEVTDAEMVHAIAPAATLVVVLVPQSAITSDAAVAAALTQVIQTGVALHASVVSISASVGEHFITGAGAAGMNAALEQARRQDVTVVASSGDTGAISDEGPPTQVGMPASDPLVLAVGGSILAVARPGGGYLGEMAWNEGTDASAGGFSSLFPRPSYQDVLVHAGATRGVPDVAANADSATAMAVEYGDGEFRPATGTSASTPLWAGVIALADQEAGRHLGFINPAVYTIARGPAYHQAFHDIVTGDNSVVWPTGVFDGYNAGPGWDPVTGWGSPDARYLVPLLAHPSRSGAGA